MKRFDKISAGILAAAALVWLAANMLILSADRSESGRPYRVEAARAALEIEEKGLENIDLSAYQYIVRVQEYGEDFYHSGYDYLIREIDGRLYRFDYSFGIRPQNTASLLLVNTVAGVMWLLLLFSMLFLRQKILRPFEQLSDMPYQLSKGNLATPLKESRNKFFGKFLWGIDLLREHIEQQKLKELDLQREKKTLLLSLSHDIKTPLSAIKLYAKALQKGLYTDKDRQREIVASINAKADEIECYLSQIIAASREDFLSFEVNLTDFYLSGLTDSIAEYYTGKLALIKTAFCIDRYTDCLLKGDPDRSVEVLQNILENAVKYGDGSFIGISFSREEDCVLISVKNSGCTLPDGELLHIFDSFWRGGNSGKVQGSGLGLYIARQLMHKMGGDIFAKIQDGNMIVTVVFQMAG